MFGESARPRIVLDRSNLRVTIVERRREQLMDDERFVAFDEVRLVATTGIQRLQAGVARAPLNGRPGNLVAVEVQDRENGTVSDGVEEAVGFPTAFERSGLGFTVADHAGDDQIGIVERRSEGVEKFRNSSRSPFSSRVISGWTSV